MDKYKKKTAEPKATVPVAALKMALEQQKQKYEAEIEALKQEQQPAVAKISKQKLKQDGTPYNNVPGSKRSARFNRQLDKVLSGVQSGKLRGKMHGEYEVIGQSTIRHYLKEHNLACGSEHAGTFQQQLIKAGWCEMKNGKVVLKQQSLDLDSAA